MKFAELISQIRLQVPIMTAVGGSRSLLSALDAMREGARLWRFLLEYTSVRQVLIASALALLGSLSEGFTLILLVPLLRLLDPAAGSAGEPGGASLRIVQFLGIQPSLGGVLAAFICLTVARSLINQQRTLYFCALRLDVVRNIRIALYSSIARSNWSFLRKIRRTDLLSALTAESDRLDSALICSFEMPARIMLIGAHVFVAFLIAPVLTLLALATGSLLAWLVRDRLIESLQIGESLSQAYKHFYHQVSEFLLGLKITKSYGAEDQHVTAFAGAIDEVKDNFLSYLRSHTNARLIQEIAGAAAVAMFLWTAATQLHMPMAEVLVLSLILYRLLPLLQSLQQDAQQLLHAAPAAQTILKLLEACTNARELSHDEARGHYSVQQGIRFEHVGFSHEQNAEESVSDVSFILPGGTLTVLFGHSGSGKSTLLDLISGLLRPSRGKIWIDERELTDERAQTWRTSIAYVLQEPFLFHDTIRANLLIAKPNATQSELREALVCSRAATFVDALPDGIDTIVGDRGNRFSGGERQRLALARALLRRPLLLVLDEPTSSLDEENEQIVLDGIEGLKGRMTMILVTHHPERVRSADQILQLERGRLLRGQ
ncbi:ABC transporter ATP-binding protein [Methylocystis sp. H62]|uniref:ATP-binding cassette domain-containing protein n=1 Tax=Methylocystis sp. H62 TaxID=2785789 RepID=UPI0018C211E8|nr:ABC transporter ATP-binding protein [Methylocystis sp. H62]MBG0792069.1 ABC transporter ATP-binding protein [Methylocystis sp. H62]